MFKAKLQYVHHGNSCIHKTVTEWTVFLTNHTRFLSGLHHETGQPL